MTLVLASASRRRADLLRELGVVFETVPSGVEEVAAGALAPPEIAVTNACRKAMAVAGTRPDATVLGADTVVAMAGRLFGKPASTDQAAAMLAELGGRTHEVTTGVCLVRRSSIVLAVFAETTRVTFRPLTPQMIQRYLRRVHVLDKAGAYAIQEHGDELVERVDGSLSNVVGLPVERLGPILARAGAPTA